MKSVWLILGEERVLVDVGSRNEEHFRGLGFSEEGVIAIPSSAVRKKRVKAES